MNENNKTVPPLTIKASRIQSVPNRLSLSSDLSDHTDGLITPNSTKRLGSPGLSPNNNKHQKNQNKSTKNDSEFQTVKYKSKPISTESLAGKNKKHITVFASSNRFAPLDIDNAEDENIEIDQTGNDLNEEIEQTKIKPPPPIFIRGVLDFHTLRTCLIDIIGANNFVVKATTKNLKVQTTNSDSYRSVIKYLKENKAEFHTYQAQEDKPFRIVIRNLHPSTPTSEIGSALEEIGGYTVRNVSNVLNKTTKNKLPIFFIDLEPAEINKDVFHINSLLNTKIRIEEPYKRRTVIQCTNCQEYGHSKSYCAHPPRCVRCAAYHPTSSCTKTKDQPPVCVLCGGNHTANYRGCQIHKDLQKLHYGKKIPNRKYNSIKDVNYSNIVKGGDDSGYRTRQDPPDIKNTSSFPNLTHQHLHSNAPNNTPPNTTINPPEFNIATQLSSFISEFKLIINPLISLLTTVINKLMKDGQ